MVYRCFYLHTYTHPQWIWFENSEANDLTVMGIVQINLEL